MKNSPTIIIIILLILTAIGAGFYFMKGKISTQSTITEKQVPQDASSQTENQSLTATLEDIIAMGKSQQCTFDYADGNITMKGTTYISGNKVRSDYTNMAGNQTVDGSMIMDGNYIYTWTSGMQQGIKMQITEDMKAQGEAAKQNQDQYKQYLDPTSKMDYKCGLWSPDAGMFTPPATVTFTDPTSQMKQMEKKCSACDNLEGESQAACKQALGCN